MGWGFTGVTRRTTGGALYGRHGAGTWRTAYAADSYCDRDGSAKERSGYKLEMTGQKRTAD